MIHLKNVSRYFGTKCAVSDVSFHITAGEIVGFIGPNGAGKSTTMRMITGYLPPSEGEISIHSYNIQECAIEAQRCMGYLPENAPIWQGMSVEGFLKYIASLRGVPSSKMREAIDKAAEACHITKVLHQGVETLSKGYRHRVCFAQAIVHDPSILILDEPTDGLDPEQKEEIRHLIKQLAKEGKTIVLSTHILDEVEAVCSRIIMIAQGKKVFDGNVEEFKNALQSSHATHVMQKAFLHFAQTSKVIKD